VGSAPSSIPQIFLLPSVAGKFVKQVGSFQVVDWKWKDLTLNFPVLKKSKKQQFEDEELSSIYEAR
jgi:hypothetical protein